MSVRTQWIVLHPCGCPTGVMEGSEARSETAVLMDFYPTELLLRRAVKRGITAKLISHEEYVKSYYGKMFPSYTCPHGGPS